VSLDPSLPLYICAQGGFLLAVCDPLGVPWVYGSCGCKGLARLGWPNVVLIHDFVDSYLSVRGTA
jgi:hypothetical protein